METRRGFFTKLGFFCTTAVTLFIIGKRHIARHKDERHRVETDARIDSEDNEFGILAKRPGFPTNNPTLDYTAGDRKSKFEGGGNAYASRRPGDRLSVYTWVKMKYFSDEEEESKYYTPSRSDKVIK
ncbi:uncharacterized protein SPAPADRAFT_140229 [Spathaspora passalidarum NRRL Y-27907]|uniref:Uncharacterized protein n=1 Tax=Spathaspora passalidarum (strain NRRL Y-27907 / 11-Y1) TaxID=619300 RepID=G3AQQ8_SPAPN|nr:uncharacterized protein SPAPADRAFT_140229 [Spathaspora passalidarum NRRL Y-27907]EGW31606.1 hypothetical protein SPAPADRAFT_140229 [Spathaspora passalidarum NRRL Y-27907]